VAVSDTPPEVADPMAESSPGFDIDLAKRQAGRIAYELGKGQPRAPIEANTPWTRFRDQLDAAHVESLTGAQQDSYTSPDGTVIYRLHVGGRTLCRSSGSVGGTSIGLTKGVNGAGSLPCPRSAEWKRLP
jgi:hypothetical protein